MSSRYSAARPKRDGETFAREHHNTGADSDKANFDVRNPSILAPEAREDDAILDADVIGGTRATKRGAVNLDGYDSDSDNETFNTQAVNRKKGKVDILDQLDNYDAQGRGTKDTKDTKASAAEDEDDDMFATSGGDDDEAKKGTDDENEDFDKAGKKKKNVKFLNSNDIKGEVKESTAGGRVHLDSESEASSEDEDDKQLAAQEEDIDEEVGAGGLKKNAPKLEAFNLREEQEEGRFDQEGNFVRRAVDPDAAHDKWLDGLNKKQIKKAAEAHEKREAEAREQRMQDDELLVSDLLKALIPHLEKAETPLEALARLGKSQVKTKKIPKWKLKKMNKGADDMDVDQKTAEDPEQARIKKSIRDITDAADKLLSRDYEDIYDQEREVLVRDYRRETGEEWVEPARNNASDEGRAANGNSGADSMWEFRWLDGRDGGAIQGPFDEAMMKSWRDAGYFGEGVEFRQTAKDDAGWTQTPSFL